jgi:hypothetical protein
MFAKSKFPIGFSLFAASAAAISCGLVIFPGNPRQVLPAAEAQQPSSPAAAKVETPAFVKTVPSGYRDWKLVSVAHEEGDLHSFAAILGNEVAMKAYREGTLPYPDGTIIAALHWRHAPSEQNNKVFGRSQSFVAGDPTNVQFMVKDSKKYAATGGWGFGHFNGRDENKPGDVAVLQSCFPCHAKAKNDLIFTHYAP